MRQVVWLFVLLAMPASCGCESSAPASPRRDPARLPASEWLGQHESTVSAGPAEPDATFGRGTSVVHIGDSFVDAFFQQNLAPHFRGSGARYVAQGTTATYTTTWAFGPDLDRWLQLRPSLVIVTLGANEFEIPAPAQHAGAVERIARRISAAGASCVWTTPPSWKQDTGIVQVIHDHCAPCLFFDSDAMLGGLGRGERRPDGIHPNARGGARWAGAFWDWINDHRDVANQGWLLRPYEVRH
jgi:hypothetical protein